MRASHSAAGFAAVLIMLGSPSVQAEVLIGAGAPLTGQLAWHGEDEERGIQLAISEISAAGGFLGETVETVVADDYCDPQQAVAAANKLIADRVKVVIGHPCSGAAIAASKVYADAGVPMITVTATNPLVTDQGFTQTFRMVGRDTVQAKMAAAYLAEHRADRRIAILHDGQAFGQGLAEVTKAELNRRGVTEAIYDQITPGGADYLDTVAELKAAGIEVLFYGGYQREAAVLIRQARDYGYDLQMIGGDALLHEDFWHIAGPAAVGVRFVSVADPRSNEGAAPVIEKFRAEGYEPKGFTLYAYAAVEVWAQAVEQAGTFEPKAVAEALHAHKFETVLGRIGFDEKGDVYGYDPFVWYVWQNGDYAPVDPAKVTD
jgi:branched-chain amino acid transport system substrate-binding protein